MKTQPRQHISNQYNTCTIVTSPVYIGSKLVDKKKLKSFLSEVQDGRHIYFLFCFGMKKKRMLITGARACNGNVR